MHRPAGVLAALLVCSTVLTPARICAAAESPVSVAVAGTALDGAVTKAASGAPAGAAAVSIAIVEDGRVVYERAAGYEDAAAKRAASTATRFRLASITKTFTAVSVMQLVERKQIDLAAPLATYLPAAPHAREVTVRQLLAHTSGIPDYLDAAFAAGAVSAPTTPAAIVARVADAPLLFAPGTRYGYSNTNYVLLGMLVEKVAGTTLAAYEQAHIFAPAGMRETSAGGFPGSAGYAVGYARGGDTAPVAAYDASWLYGCGDLVATAGDVARFDVALMNGTLLSAPSFAQMRAQPVATGEEDARYGLGVSIFPLADLTLVGHHGGVPGFEGDNEMLPEKKFAMVLLGNAFTFSTAAWAAPVLAALFPATSKRIAAQTHAAALTPAPGEDVALTARFTTLYAQFAAGKIDRTQLSAPVNAAITDAQLPAVAKNFAETGPLKRLIYRGKRDAGSYVVYTYTADFGSEQRVLTVSLDADEKVAGIFIE